MAERPDGERSPRLGGFALALLAEVGLVLTVLLLEQVSEHHERPPVKLVSMSIETSSEPAHKQQHEAAKQAVSAPQVTQAKAQQATPVPPAPTTVAQPPVIIPVPHNQMADFDISKLPRQAQPAKPGKGMMGPIDAGVPGDSKRVGTAPNGQPMYAASWYREPYDEELRGYLSTANGPGWALIACRTVADFRVDDCVGLDEYPSGSQMLRAVLGAAWQFRVRPPRVGGVSQVGAWVRIRIDYTERRP